MYEKNDRIFGKIVTYKTQFDKIFANFREWNGIQIRNRWQFYDN